MKTTDDSFLDILEAHMGVIYKVSNAYCKDVEDRKDLIQEITLQLWRSFHQYDAQYKLSTWIYKISLNTAISFYRKEHRRSSTMVWNDKADIRPVIAVAAESQPEQDENIRLLHQFVAQLPALDRALMILYLDDNSYAEIAEILGITKTNVATKISRIKQQLKTKFITQTPK